MKDALLFTMSMLIIFAGAFKMATMAWIAVDDHEYQIRKERLCK